MTVSAIEFNGIAMDVIPDEFSLRVVLADAREIAVPFEYFPRLRDATAEQRANWRLIGGGEGIGWEDLDEHISVAGLLRRH
jgi:hypothetical protein